MRAIRKSLTTFALAVFLAANLTVLPRPALAGQDGFDDQYVFATTKAVNDMEGVNPALKLTIYPVTVVLDTAFLPFAIIAGYVA